MVDWGWHIPQNPRTHYQQVVLTMGRVLPHHTDYFIGLSFDVDLRVLNRQLLLKQGELLARVAQIIVDIHSELVTININEMVSEISWETRPPGIRQPILIFQELKLMPPWRQRYTQRMQISIQFLVVREHRVWIFSPLRKTPHHLHLMNKGVLWGIKYHQQQVLSCKAVSHYSSGKYK